MSIYILLVVASYFIGYIIPPLLFDAYFTWMRSEFDLFNNFLGAVLFILTSSEYSLTGFSYILSPFTTEILV